MHNVEKKMPKTETVTLRCDCSTELLVIEKSYWPGFVDLNNEGNFEPSELTYSVSIEDAWAWGDKYGFGTRFKNAVKMLFGKKVVWASLLMNAERYDELLAKMQELKLKEME